MTAYGSAVDETGRHVAACVTAHARAHVVCVGDDKFAAAMGREIRLRHVAGNALLAVGPQTSLGAAK